MGYRLTSSKTDPLFFLKHKDYFDHSLVELLDKQSKRLFKLNADLTKTKKIVEEKTKIIKFLNLKIRDLNASHHNTINSLKEDNSEFNRKFIEDVIRKNIELEQEYEALKKEKERLEKENEKLRSSALNNSTNSSIPSSTNVFKKVEVPKKQSTNKRGGQAGHTGHFSKMKKATKVKTMNVVCAPKGAQPVCDGNNEIMYYRTQEIDLVFKAEVVETRYYIDAMGIDLEAGYMKQYDINGVRYSNKLKAMVLYMNNRGTIALKRLSLMLDEMSGGTIKVQPSTITSWMKEFARKSQSIYDEKIERLLKSPILHVDETGWRVGGELHWASNLSNGKESIYLITEKRSDKETGMIPLLEDYQGVLIHDHFRAYYQLDCDHGECNAHIIRYLRKGVDLDESIACANLMILMQKMNREKKARVERGDACFLKDELDEYEKQYLSIINETLDKFEQENPNMKKSYTPDYIKLMKRLREYKDAHLLFMRRFDVPFDNNHSERQIRVLKSKLKISGQHASLETANDFAKMMSMIQSSNLQGFNAYEEIKEILYK